MKNIVVCVVLVASICGAYEVVYAQSQQKAVPVNQALVRNQAGGPVTALDVIQMSKAGLGESVIINKIDASGASFDLSVADIIGLNKEGVSDQVINYMINTKNAPRGRAVSESAPCAVSSVPKAAVVSYVPPTPVYYVAPAPAYVVRDYYYEPPVSFSFYYSNGWGGPGWGRGGWGWGYGPGPRRRWCGW